MLCRGQAVAPHSISQAATITVLHHIQHQLIRATHTISTMQGEIDALNKKTSSLYKPKCRHPTKDLQYKSQDQRHNVTTQLKDHETKLQDQLNTLQ